MNGVAWSSTDTRSIVHETIKDGLENGIAQSVEFEAATRPSDGFITITDERAVPPAGRIGETEDLLGSVFVEGGKVSPTLLSLISYRITRLSNHISAIPSSFLQS